MCVGMGRRTGWGGGKGWEHAASDETFCKFYCKIHFIGNLQELSEHVPLNQFTIPEAILRFEFIHLVSAISSNDPSSSPSLSSSHPFYQD